MTEATAVAGSPLSSAEDSGDLSEVLKSARLKAVRWLKDHVDDAGKPVGADQRNAWWRVPWALIEAGEMNLAAGVLTWVEHNALTADGDLKAGPYGGDSVDTPVYQLSPIAIAAWQLGHYALAKRVMRAITGYQDPIGRGILEMRDANSAQSTLKTCQAGISALITGDGVMAAEVYRWLKLLYDRQPELPGRLYTEIRDNDIVRPVTSENAFWQVVDFGAPRQAFFQTGIAAAFLAGYAGQSGDAAALPLARNFLNLTLAGDYRYQFEDPESVQICKFGWGVAAMQIADPAGGHLEHVKQMGQWFIDRQEAQGSWLPSSFTLTGAPTDVDRLWKTAEHLMELAYIERALITSKI